MKKVWVIIVFFAVGMALSWAMTVGMIKLITLCFGWSFSLQTATGIWIMECGVYWVLKGLVPSKKGG